MRKQGNDIDCTTTWTLYVIQGLTAFDCVIFNWFVLRSINMFNNVNYRSA